MATKHYNIPVFVPEEGCPHRCIFCNQFGITNTQQSPHPSSIPSIVNDWIGRLGYDERHTELAFFGGSFTGISLDKQEAFLHEAKLLKDAGIIDAIRLSTRPDYIDIPRIHLLQKYGVTTVELGAQSMNDQVLLTSGRGHNAAQVAKATHMLHDAGFEVVLQMMTGLPGDSPRGAIDTALQIIELKPVATRIYPCLVMRHSPLETMWQMGKYQPQPITEAVDLAASLVDLFEKESVTVLRVGLHTSAAESVVAGPFHVSFSELVNSMIWRRRLSKTIDFSCAPQSITIHCAASSINGAAGYEASNRKWLETRFKAVNFKPDKTKNNREFYVDYC